jgi:hypothetical protein
MLIWSCWPQDRLSSARLTPSDTLRDAGVESQGVSGRADGLGRQRAAASRANRATLAGVSGIDVSFVDGTHNLLTNAMDGVILVNADTGRSRLIGKFAGLVSGDGRRLLVERQSLEADLWLMEFQK